MKPDEKIWQGRVLRSTCLHRAPWLTVRKDTLLLPTGATIPDYYVLEYPEWVSVIAITADERWVMVRQYRHGYGCFSWETPAGVVEESDADFLAAARRELAEETGYGGGEWREYMTISANPATHNNLSHVFLARNVVKIAEPCLDPTEDLEMVLMPEAEVRKLLEENRICQALHAAPMWRYFAEKHI